MITASVTELQTELTTFLEGVRHGATVLVTDHRRPFAIIQQVSAAQMPPELFEPSAQGMIRPPKTTLDIGAFLRLPKAHGEGSLTASVLEDRETR